MSPASTLLGDMENWSPDDMKNWSPQDEGTQGMMQEQGSPPGAVGRGEEMRAPDEVAVMLRLRALGWGTRRIAGALGCSRTTVQRYLEAEGWIAYRKPRRVRRLAGLEGWLEERFRRHRTSS